MICENPFTIAHEKKGAPHLHVLRLPMQQPSNVGLSTAKLGFGFTAITFAAIAATAAGSCCTDVYAPKRRMLRVLRLLVLVGMHGSIMNLLYSLIFANVQWLLVSPK